MPSGSDGDAKARPPPRRISASSFISRARVPRGGAKKRGPGGRRPDSLSRGGGVGGGGGGGEDSAQMAEIMADLTRWNDAGSDSAALVKALATSTTPSQLLSRVSKLSARQPLSPARYLVTLHRLQDLIRSGNWRGVGSDKRLRELLVAFPVDAHDPAGLVVPSRRGGGRGRGRDADADAMDAAGTAMDAARPRVSHTKEMLRLLTSLLTTMSALRVHSVPAWQAVVDAFGQALQWCTEQHPVPKTSPARQPPPWSSVWLDLFVASIPHRLSNGQLAIPASVTHALVTHPWVLDPSTWSAAMRLLREEDGLAMCACVAECVLDTTFDSSDGPRGKTFMDMQPRRKNSEAMWSFRDVWFLIDTLSHVRSEGLFTCVCCACVVRLCSVRSGACNVDEKTGGSCCCCVAVVVWCLSHLFACVDAPVASLLPILPLSAHVSQALCSARVRGLDSTWTTAWHCGRG